MEHQQFINFGGGDQGEMQMRSFEHEPDPVSMCNMCCQEYIEGTRHQCFLSIWVAINSLRE
jgi:hypothetical protein